MNNIDSKDNIPDDIKRFIQNIAFIFSNSLKNLSINNENVNFKHLGFSLSIGPDGKPRIFSFNNELEFESPLTDLIEYNQHYEVLIDAPGITEEDQIELNVEDQELEFTAVNENIKYSTKISFKQKIKNDIDIKLKNRTIILKIIKI